jgi:hypothetical protein
MNRKKDAKKLSRATELALTFLCNPSRRPSEGRYSDSVMPQVNYVLVLMEFLDNKGEKALQGLAGFYCWMLNHKKAAEFDAGIIETFNHDLGERHDEWSLPRSSSYDKIWEEEMEKFPEPNSD